MMLAIPDVLTPDEAADCRRALESAAWGDGRATAGDAAALAKANQQLSDADPLAERLGALILDRLGRSERFVAAALPLKVLPPRFNRYSDAGAYGGHVDAAVMTVPATGERIRSDLSATLFLSDPETYEGGELVVESDIGQARVKLPAGHLVLYSARSVHRVTPVTAGARYAAFFWVESLVRGDDRRSILLALDDAIRAVRAGADDHPAVTPLTGVYHNLLREWAST